MPELPAISEVLLRVYPWILPVWNELKVANSPRDGTSVRPSLRDYTLRILHDTEMEVPRHPIVWGQPFGKVRLVFREVADTESIPDCNHHRYVILDVIDVGFVTITLSTPDIAAVGEESFLGPLVSRALAHALGWLYPRIGDPD